MFCGIVLRRFEQCRLRISIEEFASKNTLISKKGKGLASGEPFSYLLNDIEASENDAQESNDKNYWHL